jgi:hypothetical protein
MINLKQVKILWSREKQDADEEKRRQEEQRMLKEKEH